MCFSEAICGYDTDEVLGYTTDKVVWIRDRWLGIPYYFLIFLILCYIFGVQMMIHCEQYKRLDVRGLAHIWYSHPTKGHCDHDVEPNCEADFRDLRSLPYCNRYRGDRALPDQAACEIEDFVQLIGDAGSDDKLFIPTSVEIITEEQRCGVGTRDENQCTYERLPGSDCVGKGEYMCQTRGGQSGQFFYVADVERYQLRFTSSFERHAISGTSLEYPGYTGVCPKLVAPVAPRTWAERKRDQLIQECVADEIELRKIACMPGKVCVTMRKYDFENDTIRGGREQVKTSVEEEIGLDIEEPDDQNGNAVAEEDAGSAFITLPPDPQEQRAHRGRFGRSGRRQRTWLKHLPQEPNRQDALPQLQKSKRLRPPAVSSNFWDGPEKEFTTPTAGDVFTLGRLLELAGSNLDFDHNLQGLTLRQAGTALEVRVVYNNMYKFYSLFGYHPVNYHYEVNELAIPHMERYHLSTLQPQDFPVHRRYELQHGVLVWFKVDGEFGFFSIVYLFVMLAAAGALTSSAKFAMDLVLVYAHPHRSNFFHLKYDVSHDFSCTWSCAKCGFKNPINEPQCRGVPAWFHAEDTPPCDELRPAEVTQALSFSGYWVDRTSDFYAGAIIKITETEWRPILLDEFRRASAFSEEPIVFKSSDSQPWLVHRESARSIAACTVGQAKGAVTYGRRNISNAACELVEVHPDGVAVVYHVSHARFMGSMTRARLAGKTAKHATAAAALAISRASTRDSKIWVLRPLSAEEIEALRLEEQP